MSSRFKIWKMHNKWNKIDCWEYVEDASAILWPRNQKRTSQPGELVRTGQNWRTKSRAKYNGRTTASQLKSANKKL